MWRLYWQLSAEGRRRFFSELMPLLHDTKLEVMGERDPDCYYLVYLGTKPSGRGRGYARKLIEHMAVRVRVPVCLSTFPLFSSQFFPLLAPVFLLVPATFFGCF